MPPHLCIGVGACHELFVDEPAEQQDLIVSFPASLRRFQELFEDADDLGMVRLRSPSRAQSRGMVQPLKSGVNGDMMLVHRASFWLMIVLHFHCTKNGAFCFAKTVKKWLTVALFTKLDSTGLTPLHSQRWIFFIRSYQARPLRRV